MERLKIAVVGGGSVFTPELIMYLADAHEKLGAMDIRLSDIDEPRQRIVYDFCNRLLEKHPADIALSAGSDVEKAVDGCQFVLLQLRQGGQKARIQDEKLGKKHRIPFVETVSICGFSTFLRTYYEYEKLAEILKRHAPDAWVLNFTNPAGQLTEALHGLGIAKAIGVCNGWISMQKTISELSGLPVGEFFMNWRGLNHLTFTDAIFDKAGNDILPALLEKLPDDQDQYPFDASLMRSLRCLPNTYLQYYYNRRKMIDKLQHLDQVRSEVVQGLDRDLLEQYKTATQIPENLTKRGGYGYSGAVASILRGIHCDEGSLHYAVVRNDGTLRSLPQDATIECPVIAKSSGVYPVVTGELPAFAMPIATSIKAYERMAIQGAKRRDKDMLLQAMMMHPLIGDYQIAKPMLDECLAMNAEYLPQIR